MLVLKNRNDTARFLYSKEGLTQGGALATIVYRIGILPLIKNIKQEIPGGTQLWYTYDAGALGTFAILKTYFDSLTLQGPGQGYYTEPSTSALIVRPENIDTGKVFGRRHVFKVCMGARFIGGYIRDKESK